MKSNTHIITYLEPKWPLFLKVNPPKQGLVQSKQRSFRFQVYMIWVLPKHCTVDSGKFIKNGDPFNKNEEIVHRLLQALGRPQYMIIGNVCKCIRTKSSYKPTNLSPFTPWSPNFYQVATFCCRTSSYCCLISSNLNIKRQIQTQHHEIDRGSCTIFSNTWYVFCKHVVHSRINHYTKTIGCGMAICLDWAPSLASHQEHVETNHLKSFPNL